MSKRATSPKLSPDSRSNLAKQHEKIDTREIPEISPERFAQAVVRQGLPTTPNKELLTIRLDRDVLAWFRKHGSGYQTRINALLRAYMEAHNKKDVA